MDISAKRDLAARALGHLQTLEMDCNRLMHGPNLRASDLYQFRGTSGRVELGSRIKTDARILAQKNYFSDGMSKDIEITGRVGGVDRRGPARTIWGLSLIHISEPTRPRLISYAVFCLKK